MKLKCFHKAQFKAAVYKLMECPGVLNDMDLLDCLKDIIDEVSEGEYDA